MEDIEIIIDPVYYPDGDNIEYNWEGCFSVPLSFAKVPRWQKINVTYINLQNEKIQKKLDGWASRVFQHEYDHLEGSLIINKASEIKTFSDETEYKCFLHNLRKHVS